MKTCLIHREQPYLINRAEPVLTCPEKPEASLCALEVQNSINHMLDNLRTCQSTFLCHMSYEENGGIEFLCDKGQFHAASPYLIGRASCGRNRRAVERLQ